MKSLPSPLWCHIYGNDELRKQELPAMCPIIPTGLQSLSQGARPQSNPKGVENPAWWENAPSVIR